MRWLLILFLLFPSYYAAPLGKADIESALSLSGDPLSRGAGGVSENLGAAVNTYFRVSRISSAASLGYKTWITCEAAGNSNCGELAGLCFILANLKAPSAIVTFVYSGYQKAVLNSFCLGDPVLKCCRTEKDGDCHSAFNEEAPINCENNPAYGPTSTPGLCRRPCPDCPGCICDYLAECIPPVGGARELEESTEMTPALHEHRFLQQSPFEEYGGSYFHLSRMDGHLISAARIVNKINRLKPRSDWALIEGNGLIAAETNVATEMLDFITFRGCKGFAANFAVLKNNVGTVVPVNYRGDEVDRPDDFVDQFPALRQRFVYYAMARMALDVPQFWLRIDYIKGTIWNDETRQATLDQHGISDPETEILKFVDYGGLQLMQLTLKSNWPLILVPVDESLWELDQPSEDEGLLAHCSEADGRAQPTEIRSFVATVDGSTATIKLEVDDGVEDFLAVRVYWGDGTPASVTILSTQSAPTIEVTHNYASPPGLKEVTVQLTNNAGLRTVVRDTIDISGTSVTMPAMVDYPNVDSIEFEINLQKGGNRFGRAGQQMFYFEGTAQESHEVELSDVNATIFSDLGGYENDDDSVAPSLLTVNLPWNGDPLRHIRFTCRTVDHYIGTRGVATIQKVQIRTVDGSLINVPLDNTDETNCARRGNLYEDTQALGIVSLGSAAAGTVVEEGAGLVDPMFRPKGFYFESFPGRYSYFATLDEITAQAVPTPAPTSNGGGGSVGVICFSGDSTVEVTNRGTIPMRELHVGDQVRVADGSFERVETFGHKSDSITAQYIELSFAGGGSLTMSQDHMVFVENHGFKAASGVRPGERLKVLAGADSIVVDRISQVTKVGAYAPFTQSGTIVVNGVVVSNYITFPINLFGFDVTSGHWLAHVSQAPHRLALLMGWCANDSFSVDGISAYVPIEYTEWLLEQNSAVFLMLFVPIFLISLAAYGLEHAMRFLLLS